MKCHISMKHSEGEFGEWTEAKNLPNYELAISDTDAPVIRINESILFFKPDKPNPATVKASFCSQKYRLLPKGTVVVLTQE